MFLCFVAVDLNVVVLFEPFGKVVFFAGVVFSACEFAKPIPAQPGAYFLSVVVESLYEFDAVAPPPFPFAMGDARIVAALGADLTVEPPLRPKAGFFAFAVLSFEAFDAV